MSDILEVNNLAMKFDQELIFENLKFKLKQGSMTALLGPNGTGKTTLINILMKMLVPTAGNFKFDSNTRLGYVPQFRNINPEYPLSIEAFVGLNAPLIKNRKIKQAIKAQLKETNLYQIRNTRMGEASGGQKQRAYLAQALLENPNMIILDEATASLDPLAKDELMKLIRHLNQKHKITVLFVTHDVPLAKKYMQDYLYLNHHKIEQGSIAQFEEAYD